MSYKLTKSCLEDNIGPICIHILIRVIFIVTRHFQITNYCNINTIANEKFRKCKDQLECHKWFLGFIHCLCCCIIKLIKYVHIEAFHWSNIAPTQWIQFLNQLFMHNKVLPMIECYRFYAAGNYSPLWAPYICELWKLLNFSLDFI